MPKYKRNYVKGGTYFFTAVVYKRRKIFHDATIQILRESFRKSKAEKPFVIDAIVILPEHIHCILTLPIGDSDYSGRWKAVKSEFTKQYVSQMGDETLRPTESMRKKGEKGVWQKRFWEHTVRDDWDFKVHFDYIHYNPVKHGLVKSPMDWPYSSFHRWVAKGIYSKNGPPRRKILPGLKDVNIWNDRMVGFTHPTGIVKHPFCGWVTFVGWVKPTVMNEIQNGEFL